MEFELEPFFPYVTIWEEIYSKYSSSSSAKISSATSVKIVDISSKMPRMYANSPITDPSVLGAAGSAVAIQAAVAWCLAMFFFVTIFLQTVHSTFSDGGLASTGCSTFGCSVVGSDIGITISLEENKF